MSVLKGHTFLQSSIQLYEWLVRGFQKPPPNFASKIILIETLAAERLDKGWNTNADETQLKVLLFTAKNCRPFIGKNI